MNDRIVIATRRSRLALWQSEHCADLLRQAHPGLEVALLPLSTRGDEVQDRSLAEIGGKGLFLKELEAALLDGRADLAVHSLKDVPAESPDGLVLSAFLARADARDMWISTSGDSLAELPAGSRVGTSSLRRVSQLLAVRGDLETVPLRGNVETRLSAVGEGRVEATILAAAGLQRLELSVAGSRPLAMPDWLPAPGQGVIAIQQRADDVTCARVVTPLSCAATALQVRAEREVVRVLGGDCRMPLAAWAQAHDDARLTLHARLGDGRGGLVEARHTGAADAAEALGRACARTLLENGGRECLKVLGLSHV